MKRGIAALAVVFVLWTICFLLMTGHKLQSKAEIMLGNQTANVLNLYIEAYQAREYAKLAACLYQDDQHLNLKLANYRSPNNFNVTFPFYRLKKEGNVISATSDKPIVVVGPCERHNCIRYKINANFTVICETSPLLS